ncbi:MAG TPA: hypothetical protein VF062_05315 [Candidatus Limnocylindrales bacterium]
MTLAAGREPAQHQTVSRATERNFLPQAESAVAEVAKAPEAAEAAPAPAPEAAAPAAEAAPALPWFKEPAEVTPVAGLDQTQMNNATRIVETARSMGLGRDAQIIAVATAMQESTLYNRASTVLPESYNYPHQGDGSDFDSVGLFQQRTSTGWGAVKDLMDPEFATKQFLKALITVPGWQRLPLTVAAQTVQGSAFPDHYAKHESPATVIVDEINK